MKLKALLARLVMALLGAGGFAVATNSTAVLASSFCYSYSYSNSVSASPASYIDWGGAVDFDIRYSCSGQPLEIYVKHVHTYYTDSYCCFGAFHQQNPIFLYPNDLTSQASWGDGQSSPFNGPGTIIRDDYPNVTIAYDSTAYAFSSVYNCSAAGGGSTCAFTHYFVTGQLSWTWGS